MLPLSWKIGIWAAIGVAVVTTVGLAYRHYSGLVDAKAELSAKVATLEQDVAREKTRAEALEKSIAAWDGASKAQVKALEELTNAQREAGRFKSELLDVLSRHDLEALARAKPGMVEKRVNTGSARALRMLEHATEVPPRTDEGAAAGGAPEASAREAGGRAVDDRTVTRW
jgi:hypothetical protein